ncbi:hypothetical protein YPC_4481 [Yersinia pestis biovar Medievalis str. Harbin 35]|uniref:Uncharacterized protein n=4 Tax=Yersinia pestis TaxID=632 RepID=Q8CKA6_YERPE|nr:hypothetical [Yersinia pestis KIM10+]AAS63503.1 hypothetical protein YP_3338 [Yersinia pestis biovar Microtus str. 91001]ABG15765.1 conserved hypothetical protein [Yersinia pestis Antiqua]ABG19951.1 conserved hypothetical protein [Yersinia pestis Nepal516]ABP41695.1 conserved hypothetical protein [Yersinia pestis Pestoides F]ADW00874.1 hypothetical protein YPC_4481 [Yersinia pestis biovar Medievalis str. Harbin 35]EDR33813.1 conserved hypothetical protein [Yersinia pestis biovar Orientalis
MISLFIHQTVYTSDHNVLAVVSGYCNLHPPQEETASSIAAMYKHIPFKSMI